MNKQEAAQRWAVTCLVAWSRNVRLSKSSAEIAAQHLTTLTGRKFEAIKREIASGFYYSVTDEIERFTNRHVASG